MSDMDCLAVFCVHVCVDVMDGVLMNWPKRRVSGVSWSPIPHLGDSTNFRLLRSVGCLKVVYV
jgi:hypothetical protein